MSDQTPAAPKITVRHYQVVCGLALAGILMLQFQQGSQSILNTGLVVLIQALILVVGGVAILYPLRVSPMLIMIGIAAPMALEQYYSNQGFNPDLRAVRLLDLADVLMCMAGLVFFVGHYRLQGLWFGVLPADKRQPAGPGRRRSEESLSLAELAPLVITAPALALLAQVVGVVLRLQWSAIDLPPRWRQLLLVAWTILLGVTLAAQAFRYWRRLQMDRATALLMLQDILWNETRGEQRRLQRWLAWKQMQAQKKSK